MPVAPVTNIRYEKNSRSLLFSFLSSVFIQGALEMFATEVKARKVCLDDGFQWGGEDVRMGEKFSEK